MEQSIRMNNFSYTGGALFLLGVFLATALFFITIYFGLDRKRSYLFFFAYALLGSASLLFLGEKMPVPFLVSSTLASVSLLYFFASFFESEKSAGAAVFGVILLLLAAYNFQFAGPAPKAIFFVITWFIYILSLMACSWISLRAINRKIFAGKLLFITTTAIFLLMIFLISNSFFVSSLAISSVLLILSVTYTVFNDFRERQSLLESLKTKAVRLENEMLKKTIQPHFLMNTLTVLSEWIESEPALAVKQIELLSEEFRYITRVSGEKLVRIEDELKMCRVHLDIFNAKQHSEFKLEERGIKPNTPVPPIIFHTLIENGLTHSGADKGTFVIEQEDSGKAEIFKITSGPLTGSDFEGEGLGISYIKSRLEGAFPGKWEFNSEPGENAWITTIKILK